MIDKDLIEAKFDIIGTSLNAILTDFARIGEAEQVVKENPSWNGSKIPWKETEGTKGKYERYPASGEKTEDIIDYQNLLADLKEHDGKLTRDGFFYWCFENGVTVARKKRKF